MKSYSAKLMKLSQAELALAFAHAVVACAYARAAVAEVKTTKLHGKYAKNLSANRTPPILFQEFL
jgi:lipoprotein